MFLKLLFLVALLQFGESQTTNYCQCVNEIQALKADIQREVRTTITNEGITREDMEELVEDKATEEDVIALSETVSAGNTQMTNTLASNQNVITEAVETLRGDVRQRASEVVQALNHSVTTGNRQVVDILGDTVALVEATQAAIEQEQCVTREEVQNVVRAEVESVVRNEVQPIQTEVQSLTMQLSAVQNEMRSLINYIDEAQRNNTALLSEAIDLLSYQHPFLSCKNIPPGRPSGYYWIQGTPGTVRQQYCDMTRTCCNSTGGWMQVANLDMTDPNQQCPAGFNTVTRETPPRHTCGRPGPAACVSTIYPVHGVQYSKVCGRVIGYQFSSSDGFGAYVAGSRGQNTVDSAYVDGVSLTHGSAPRNHIWTFAGAHDEVNSYPVGMCECTRPDLPFTATVPPFIGEDYFCETGSRNHFEWDRFYSEDPLWDGQGCGEQSTCCEFNNPPWFCKQLAQPTHDDIELRLCGDEITTNEDTPLEIVEIYVQ